MLLNSTTILVPKTLKKELDALKNYSRETYADVIARMLAFARSNEDDLELSDEVLEDVRVAREEIKKGQGYSTAQLKKKLGI